MENKSYAFVTLLFTAILGTTIVCILLFLGHDKSEYAPYRIITEHSVGSLNKSGKVKFNGIDVGRVTELRFSKDAPGYIAIDLELKKEAPITKSTIATIAYQPVTGISSIDLSDEGTNPEKLVTSEETPAYIPMVKGTYHTVQTRGLQIIREVQTVTQSLATLLDGRHNRLVFSTIHDLRQRSKSWAEAPWYIYAASLDAPENLHEGHEVVKTLHQLAVDVKKVSILVDEEISKRMASDDIEHLEEIAQDSRAILNNINSILNNYRRGQNSLLIQQKRVTGPGE